MYGKNYMKLLRATAQILCLVLIFPLIATIATASGIENDTHSLTTDEKNTFIPLVCEKPGKQSKTIHCAKVIGFPSDSGENVENVNISFDAVAYGSLTRQEADEAYVTYSSPSLEPHSNNFGGGILFERINDRWKLIKWFRGGQMNKCLAFLVDDRQNMLCLDGYAGQGEVDSSIWVEKVPATGESPERKLILGAQDGRETGDQGNYQCGLKRAKDEGILLTIHDLKRSQVPGFFAEAFVTYATVPDVNSACRKGRFAQVRETRGVVRFILKDGTIEAVSPAKFAKTDYGQ